MNNEDQPNNSRRRFIRGALTLSLAPLLLATVRAQESGAQKSGGKLSKDDAEYQDESKNGDKCSECRFFQEPDGCEVVEGEINPEGWCKLYAQE